MKIPLIITLLLASVSAYAVDLCDAGCNVLIEFPDGGSLHATQPLTITFGDNGLIDTVGGLVPYLEGATLTLDEGGSLEFGPGGSLDIGDAGNISYTDMEIVTSGAINFTAVGGPQTITIEALTVTGPATLTITAEHITIYQLSMPDGPLVIESTTTEGETCSASIDSGVTISSGSDPITNVSCDSFPDGLISFDGTLPLPHTDIELSSGQHNLSGSDASSKGSISVFYFLILMLPLLYRRRR